MKSIAALWYLDFHRARNALRAIVRSPLRLLVWVFIGVWITLQVLQRATRSAHIFVFHDLSDPVATGIAGAVLVLYGVTLARPTGFGRIMAFGDPVDAMFLARSAIDERLVVFWLQLRQLLLNSWRIAFGVAFIGLYFSRGNPLGAMAGVAGVFILLELLLLPTAIIARRTDLLKHVWYTIAGIGLLVFIGAFLAPASIVTFGLGRALIAIWHGAPMALVSLYGCIVAVLLAGAVRADDVYPEFYAAARTTETARGRVRRGDFLRIPTSAKATRSGSTMLRGPWVEIWKQLAFVRRGNGLAIVGIGSVIALALGIASGQLFRHGTNAPVLGGSVLGLVLVLQTTRSVSLAQDISKPLWWMGDGSTFSKLAIWTFASSLPALAFAALATVAMFAVVDPARILLFVLSVSAAVVVSRAVGVLGYALTPALIDQRGPGVFIRLLLLYASFIAPIAFGVIGGLTVRSADLGLASAALTFLAEGALCIMLAVVRLNGRGMEIALAESS
jgi:Putative ABC exporter